MCKKSFWIGILAIFFLTAQVFAREFVKESEYAVLEIKAEGEITKEVIEQSSDESITTLGTNNEASLDKKDDKSIYAAWIAGDPKMKLPKDKDLYIIVTPDGQVNDIDFPPTHIGKLNLKSDKNGTIDVGFASVQEFNVKATDDLKIFYDYRFAMIKTSNDLESDFIDANIIFFDKPWQKKTICNEDFTNALYPATINNKEVLLSYDANEKPIIKCYDLRSIKSTNRTPEQITPFAEEGCQFIIEDGKTRYDKRGMKNYYYPYTPPSNLLEGKKELFLEADTKQYLLFGVVKDKNEEEIVDIGFDKVKQKWFKIIIQGDDNTFNLFNNIAVYQILKDSKEEYKPDIYSGELAIVNLENGNNQKIKLDVEDSIVYADRDYIIVVSGNKLLYYPVINNKIDLTKAILLCEDELVHYIKGVFFGPKEIPVSLKKGNRFGYQSKGRMLK